MRRLSFINQNRKYEQISKREALKRYLTGENILICAANLRPFSIWAPACLINKGADGTENTFYLTVSMYTHYNCINNETGRYPVFYKEEATK